MISSCFLSVQYYLLCQQSVVMASKRNMCEYAYITNAKYAYIADVKYAYITNAKYTYITNAKYAYIADAKYAYNHVNFYQFL